MSNSANSVASYAIIGFGQIGKALARAFARKGIEVSVATTRNPESFAADTAAIGPGIMPKTVAEAVKADIIFLAVRFESHADVAKALPGATADIAVLSERLGFAPVNLGGLSEGGLLVQAHGNSWGKLIFQDLIKFN